MDDQRSYFVGCGVEEGGVSVAVRVQVGDVAAVEVAAAVTKVCGKAEARGADVGAVKEDDGVEVGDGGVHGGDPGVRH